MVSPYLPVMKEHLVTDHGRDFLHIILNYFAYRLAGHVEIHGAVGQGALVVQLGLVGGERQRRLRAARHVGWYVGR